MTTTTTTTTTTKTTIASLATIQLTGAAVLVPHLARRGFDVVVFTKLSCAICKHADARAFVGHQRAEIRVFVLGQGWRDDGTNSVVVGDSS